MCLRSLYSGSRVRDAHARAHFLSKDESFPVHLYMQHESALFPFPSLKPGIVFVFGLCAISLCRTFSLALSILKRHSLSLFFLISLSLLSLTLALSLSLALFLTWPQTFFRLVSSSSLLLISLSSPSPAPLPPLVGGETQQEKVSVVGGGPSLPFIPSSGHSISSLQLYLPCCDLPLFPSGLYCSPSPVPSLPSRPPPPPPVLWEACVRVYAPLPLFPTSSNSSSWPPFRRTIVQSSRAGTRTTMSGRGNTHCAISADVGLCLI